MARIGERVGRVWLVAGWQIALPFAVYSRAVVYEVHLSLVVLCMG